MDTINDRPAVLIASADEVMAMEEAENLRDLEIQDGVYSIQVRSSITSHVLKVFQDNKDVRLSSGMQRKLLESLRAYNGHYDPEDLARIRESGGSEIYMNLTPTKCRAAMSWLRDIFQAAKENAWSLEATPIPDLPDEIVAQIEQGINELAEPPQVEGGQAKAMQATQRLADDNKIKRDIEDAISDEIYRIANSEVKKFEQVIADQLVEGDWENALSDFIEDFCVFQVAVMKAPVITKKTRLTWEGGEAVPVEEFIYLNKRVSPLDIYPSPSATSITDGDLCEHIRMSRKELYNLIGVPGYKEEAIRRVLQTASQDSATSWLDTQIENDKTVEEYRGDTYRANKGVIHGIHFHGSAPYSVLKEWGLDDSVIGIDTEREFEVEAILAGEEVIKCVINDDPLLRRPYYKASFQSIPGSWWGRSLPELMRDIQRMCNATARALSNNMGIASGPQIEVYIDRLAADEEIDSIHPLKIWQLTSDPTGAGGRAVQFWQPTSNAKELLAVYKEFEIRADDATGIPRYAYGNERTGGAVQTASGLSMMLESASKGIKDAARYIDVGLIKPRVEYQFYWNMITNDEIEFTGDVNVIPKGSQALTMKGSQEMRRNEFLGILANPQYQQIVGIEGIAEILREMAKSLGLGENIIPSKVELRKKQDDAERAAAEQQQAEAQRAQEQNSTGVQQVQMQTQQAEMASQRNAQIKVAEIQQSAEEKDKDRQVKVMEMDQRRESDVSKNTAALGKQQMVEAGKIESDNKSIALSIRSGFQDKSNKE